MSTPSDDQGHQPGINLYLLFTLGFANFVIGMGAFVVIGVLKPLSIGLDMSLSQAGQVLSLYALGYAISSPLLAALTGGWARRRVLLVGLCLFLIGTLAASLAPTPTLLLIARVFSAFGAAIFTPAAFSVAVSTSQLQHRGRALSIVGAGLTLAQVAGIPIGTWLGFSFGWRVAFGCVVSLGIIALLLSVRFIPKKIQHKPITLTHLSKSIRDPRLISAVLFTAFFLTATYMVFTFMTLLMQEKLQLGRDGITLCLMVVGVGAFVGNLIGGFATDRIGAIPWLVIAVTCQMILLPALTTLDYDLIVGILLFFVWAVMVWSFMVPQQFRMVRINPESQNVSLALNASCIYLGTAVGAGAGGLALEKFGLNGLGPIAAGVMSLALVLLIKSAHMFRENTSADMS